VPYYYFAPSGKRGKVEFPVPISKLTGIDNKFSGAIRPAKSEPRLSQIPVEQFSLAHDQIIAC
jgi:hypothetical protein